MLVLVTQMWLVIYSINVLGGFDESVYLHKQYFKYEYSQLFHNITHGPPSPNPKFAASDTDLRRMCETHKTIFKHTQNKRIFLLHRIWMNLCELEISVLLLTNVELQRRVVLV